VQVRPLVETDRDRVLSPSAYHFGSIGVVSRGVLQETRLLPGLVAVREAEKFGLLRYRVERGGCEVVGMVATEARQGFDRLFLQHTQKPPPINRFNRLWLVTTDDNIPA
jgi:hypothetical protein